MESLFWINKITVQLQGNDIVSGILNIFRVIWMKYRKFVQHWESSTEDYSLLDVLGYQKKNCNCFSFKSEHWENDAKTSLKCNLLQFSCSSGCSGHF